MLKLKRGYAVVILSLWVFFMIYIFLCNEAQNIFSLKKNKKIIHTYHNNIKEWSPNSVLHKENMKQLLEWEKTWKNAGWETRILSSKDIDYSKFKIDKIMKNIPLGRSRDYDYHCYLRHFAMASVGGGWMSDHDLIPLGLESSELPNDGKYTVHEYAVPSLVSGSQKEWERIALDITDLGRSMENKTELFSDMMALQALPLSSFVHSTNVLGYDEKRGILLFQDNYSKIMCKTIMMYHGAHLSHAAMTKYKNLKVSRAKIYKELAEKISRECKDL
tara:strand:+ start:258 stop:1082 length:825 start_codon:yes stop_codon:yes gene_type:complete